MAEVVRVGHSDPGHGWLAVKLSDLKMLGIEANITDFSYIKGKTAYLEEDKDAARSALGDIPQVDELLLWRAPTKGSVFTTKERGFLKS